MAGHEVRVVHPPPGVVREGGFLECHEDRAAVRVSPNILKKTEEGPLVLVEAARRMERILTAAVTLRFQYPEIPAQPVPGPEEWQSDGGQDGQRPPAPEEGEGPHDHHGNEERKQGNHEAGQLVGPEPEDDPVRDQEERDHPVPSPQDHQPGNQQHGDEPAPEKIVQRKIRGSWEPEARTGYSLLHRPGPRSHRAPTGHAAGRHRRDWRSLPPWPCRSGPRTCPERGRSRESSRRRFPAASIPKAPATR